MTKGQLISKCPFGFIVWTKIPTKLRLGAQSFTLLNTLRDPTQLR